jgi:tRNA pseudouridine38-40 synthase
MPRYKITIEYDGTNISGWQRQLNSSSVQQFIEEAIGSFSHEKIVIFGAGRTDSGVHALAQVAHFDLEKTYPEHVVIRAINHFLRPNKIVITSCQIVDKNFHARFSAKKRHYRYVILNRAAISTLEENRSWHIREPLDIEKMQQAANFLIGHHDFTSFRATHCQALSPIKTLDEIKIYQEEEKIIITIKATSFLHHMVRNITGTLVPVGLGKLIPEDIKKILEEKIRRAAGPTAPAHGLYFSMVEYD